MKTIKTLSDKRQEAARLLCNGIKAKEIARIFGIHKSTVWRWKRTPEFQAAFFVELYARLCWRKPCKALIRSRLSVQRGRRCAGMQLLNDRTRLRKERYNG